MLSKSAKDVASAIVEAVWACGFALAGRIQRRPVDVWSSPGGQRVMIVAPHPDDEVIGCGGTLLRHSQAGDVTCVVYVTDGRGSQALGLRSEEMARRRQQEAESSAKALQVDRFEWLGLPEDEWRVSQLEGRLAALIDRLAPDLIYSPSRVDFHPEHRRVAQALSLALTGDPLVRVYQVQVPLTAILTNLIDDVSAVMAACQIACEAYATQWDSVIRTHRLRRYAAWFYRCGQYVEGFWQMSAAQYRLLHSADPSTWATDEFRGIRFRALSDPMAYLHGRSARRRLADLIRQQTSEQRQSHNGPSTFA